MPILSAIIWMPLVGVAIILLMPKQLVKPIQSVGVIFSGISFVLSWKLLWSFDGQSTGMQFAERYAWIPEMGMTYSLGLDGLSFPMVLLTSLLSLVSMIVAMSITDRVKGFFAWFLLLESALLGVFMAQDWFLFYMFWEITLIPMFFLIGIWGGKGRGLASMSFFLYTLAGSVFMLLGIIAAYLSTPEHTFDMLEMVEANTGWSREFQIFGFVAFFLGMAVKVPVFPLHGWLPLAHVEAPVPISMMLSGVLLKMGAYGLIRAALLFPMGIEWAAKFLWILAALSIVYGALMAWLQTDLKAMVAYSSISHMGFVVMGISGLNLTGFSGAVFQMFAHGLITGALFLLVGVIYERTHTRESTDFGGLSQVVPIYAGMMSLAFLASMGLPGMAGFIGEFHALLGAFERWGLWVILATLGILITAAYSLRAIGQMFMGEFNTRWEGLNDMSPRELIALSPLAILIIGLGIFPGFGLALIHPTLAHIVAAFK